MTALRNAMTQTYDWAIAAYDTVKRVDWMRLWQKP